MRGADWWQEPSYRKLSRHSYKPPFLSSTTKLDFLSGNVVQPSTLAVIQAMVSPWIPRSSYVVQAWLWLGDFLTVKEIRLRSIDPPQDRLPSGVVCRYFGYSASLISSIPNSLASIRLQLTIYLRPTCSDLSWVLVVRIQFNGGVINAKEAIQEEQTVLPRDSFSLV